MDQGANEPRGTARAVPGLLPPIPVLAAAAPSGPVTAPPPASCSASAEWH